MMYHPHFVAYTQATDTITKSEFWVLFSFMKNLSQWGHSVSCMTLGPEIFDNLKAFDKANSAKLVMQGVLEKQDKPEPVWNQTVSFFKN